MNFSTEPINPDLQILIVKTRESIGEVKKVALAQAWKILQLATAQIIQVIEVKLTELTGPDKKIIAMQALSQFYDSVFVTITLPFIPLLVQPIIHKYVKALLMLLVSATIDAMVTTFREAGIFKRSNKEEVKS